MTLSQHLRQGKAKFGVALHANHARAGCRGVDLVHAEGGSHDEHFVCRFQIGFAQQVNGFVHSVGQQDLFGREAEMLGDDCFDRFAFGIAREILGCDLL